MMPPQANPQQMGVPPQQLQEQEQNGAPPQVYEQPPQEYAPVPLSALLQNASDSVPKCF